MLPVEVAYAKPEQQVLVAINVEEGATVADAIAASGVLETFPELAAGELRVGVFAQVCGLQRLLKAGDRVEIYRPLYNDPKEARRQRAAKK
jgi:putative ubiquitin-RnfH superfamily antitoxin RatB of RatAB toxin-antitoxin module